VDRKINRSQQAPIAIEELDHVAAGLPRGVELSAAKTVPHEFPIAQYHVEANGCIACAKFHKAGRNDLREGFEFHVVASQAKKSTAMSAVL
jgi:hypothetical protein